MWCADNWKDYELIDTADGERLERWGKYILIRPDPQIIWKGCATSPLWKKADGSAVGSGIFNGDVGTLLSIDPQMETVTVAYDDRIAEYDFTQMGELEPAYAMTVHKSQGSEYRAVILAAWGGSPYLLSRSVLYTAITRARELLIIVGRAETVQTMTENAKRNRRYTGLKLRLQGKCQ